MTAPKHDHFTRDIKPPASGCPACVWYWKQAGEIINEKAKRYGQDKSGLKRNPNKPVQRPRTSPVGDPEGL